MGNLCVDRFVNDVSNTDHGYIKVQPVCPTVQLNASSIDNSVDGSMGMNIYWLAKPPFSIASIYGRIPAATPNMFLLPASMQQIVLFSEPRATRQVHPWYRPRIGGPFSFNNRYW